MGCTLGVTMEGKPSSSTEIRSYKRQLSLSDLERFLRTGIQRGSNATDSKSQLDIKKQIESAGKSPTDRLQVYGRLCTTKDADTAPVNLSDAPGRKTAFIFGPDTVYGALIENIHDPYTMLLRLGFLPEYIHQKACKQKACYWLIVLTPPQESAQPGSPHALQAQPVPATWDGLMSFIRVCYPEALPAVQAHWDLITTKPVEFFEERSDVRFIEALSNPKGPDYMSYEKFQSLPKPQTDWETRLFLYCELRILELFSGDGHTWSDAGVKGEKEYISPNYLIETDLGKNNCICIPLKVEVPWDVRDKFDEK